MQGSLGFEELLAVSPAMALCAMLYYAQAEFCALLFRALAFGYGSQYQERQHNRSCMQGCREEYTCCEVRIRSVE
jgi:hypothetical protein